MGIFGWSYPPGAALDPFAPYNQTDDAPGHDYRKRLASAFADYRTPAELAHAVYKHGACGASVQFLIDGDWCRGDAAWLRTPWRKLHGLTAIRVSSIVEGVEQTTQTHIVDLLRLPARNDKALFTAFWSAVESVEQEAAEIWHNTHGCDVCAEHFGIDLDDDHSPVWNDCPNCCGDGFII
jgi:hypothetical protein